VSSPEHPAAEITPPSAGPAQLGVVPVARLGVEDPPWDLWGVMALLAIAIVSFFFFSIVVLLAAKYVIYRSESVVTIGQRHPLLGVLVELLMYGVLLSFMAALVRRSGRGFLQGLQWNWPSSWWGYLVLGFVLAIGLGILESKLHLPMPEHPPMERFFRTSRDAWLLVGFGTLVAPFMEELFFRGFLYPALARRVGIYASIFLTSLSFGLIHAAQFAFAWAPVLVIVMVGVVLTLVRALRRSVAGSMLVHFAYNLTLFTAMFVQTQGFRHLGS